MPLLPSLDPPYRFSLASADDLDGDGRLSHPVVAAARNLMLAAGKAVEFADMDLEAIMCNTLAQVLPLFCVTIIVYIIVTGAGAIMVTTMVMAFCWLGTVRPVQHPAQVLHLSSFIAFLLLESD